MPHYRRCEKVGVSPSLSLRSKPNSFSTLRNRAISISLIAMLCCRDEKVKHIGQNAYNIIINAMRMDGKYRVKIS